MKGRGSLEGYGEEKKREEGKMDRREEKGVKTK
jgi:hypothetical protein